MHKGLSAEDLTSDRAGRGRQTFSPSGGANGSRGGGSSSFAPRGVTYQPDGLISTEGVYHTSHPWALTRGRRTNLRPPETERSLKKRQRIKGGRWTNGTAPLAELTFTLEFY